MTQQKTGAIFLTNTACAEKLNTKKSNKNYSLPGVGQFKTPKIASITAGFDAEASLALQRVLTFAPLQKENIIKNITMLKNWINNNWILNMLTL